MKIRVKLISMDGVAPSLLDEWGEGNIDVPAGATVCDALNALGIAPDTEALTMVGGDAVALPLRATQILHDGDELTLFPPIQGG